MTRLATSIAVAIAGSITAVCCAQSQSADQHIPLSGAGALEAQVQTGRAVEALMDLYKAQFLGPNELSWLFRKAHLGEPPFQYELARRVQQGILPGSVIEWYAKGYVIRSLDAAECSTSEQNPADMAIRTLYAPLRDLALSQPGVYADELERAIDWEAKRPLKRSSKWICGDALRPSEERQAARANQLDEIRRGIARLREKK